MADDGLDRELARGVEEAWLAFVDRIEPLRRDLFRFSLGLTGNPFDAEDLVHNGMLRAFGTLGQHREPIRHPRPPDEGRQEKERRTSTQEGRKCRCLPSS